MTRSPVPVPLAALTVLYACAACYVGVDSRDLPEDARASDLGTCEELGYAGTCVQDVSLWYEDGGCRIRDCASEGRHCGYISDDIGWGCLEGTSEPTTLSCSDVGYEGTCLSDDVLVWTEDASCRWVDCAATGRACAWTESVGFDCVHSPGSADGDDSAPDMVVAGVTLGATQARWVEHIAERIVPELPGDLRVTNAAVVAWWSLKEGVLDLDNPLSYSNCHFPPDEHIGPTDVCPDPDNPWQVGIAGVQAAWRDLEEVEALASSVHPGKSTVQVLVDAADTAGFGPGTSVGEAIAASTGRLRLSWLLRDGAVGFEAQHPVIHRDCFVDERSWCFGTGWDTSAAFAPDRWTAEQAIDDLEHLLVQLAP